MIPKKTLDMIRSVFEGTIILCNGLTIASAETALWDGLADLVAFGRNYLANPDLDKRIAGKTALNQADPMTFYTPGEKGYTDYPLLNKVAQY
jgi:N-ethylmaleimide reductase